MLINHSNRQIHQSGKVTHIEDSGHVRGIHLLHKYTVAQVSVITRIIISLPSRGGNYLVRTMCGRILVEVYAKCQCEHFLCHNEFFTALINIKTILLHSNLLVFIQSSRLIYESLFVFYSSHLTNFRNILANHYRALRSFKEK